MMKNKISLKSYLKLNLKRFYKLSKSDKNKLISLDRKFNDIVMMSRNNFDEKIIYNDKEEMEKFFEYKKENKKYFPKLKVDICKYEQVKIVDKIKQLINEFNNFDCILSNFYIDRLQSELEWCNMQIDRVNGKQPRIKPKNYTYQDYKESLELLKQNPYISDVKGERNIDSEEAKIRIQDALDKLNIPWKAKIKDDVLARMCVLPNKIIHIQKEAKFDETDIDGLIEHEIKGHILKRFYGLKTGLYLFVHGLSGKNVTSEGIAIWNSLNNVKKPKKNIIANIALRFVISYNKSNMDFCDLFDFIKHIYPSIPDDVLFKTILRSKREVVDTEILGGLSKDSDYFLGYKYINSLSEKDRNKLNKWNIGIDQVKYIDVFDNFFKVNKFESLI